MSEHKIIVVCYSLNVGGAERRIAAICNKLAEFGVKVRIVLLDEPHARFSLNPEITVDFLDFDGRQWDVGGNVAKVNIRKFDMSNRIAIGDLLKLWWFGITGNKKRVLLEKELFLRNRYARLIRAYVSEFPDWTVISFMSYCNVATMMALEHLPNRAAFSECTSPEIEFPSGHPMNTLKKRYYPRARGAFFQTDDERDFYTYLDCRKWVIPNPLQGSFPERFEGARRKEIVAFARIEKDKNFPMLINAFEMLVKEHPDYMLNFYGEGGDKGRLVKMVQSKGLEDKVVFHGFDTNLHDKIKDCAMFVSTSNREGMSNSMLEALAIGLPSICTDCPAGGARMMIRPYENGLLVPMRDSRKLYLAMKELVEHPELAEKFSVNSVKVKDELEIGSIAEKWLKAIEELEA